jgi:hypothetical protein
MRFSNEEGGPLAAFRYCVLVELRQVEEQHCLTH